MNIATTFVAIAMIDWVGRKPLLLIGSAGMMVTMATMAVTFCTAPEGNNEPNLTRASGPIAPVAANLYVVFFGMSWGPIVWALLNEMFNNRIRALALSVGAAAQWLANFTITLTFPPLSAASVALPYLLYAISRVAVVPHSSRGVCEKQWVASSRESEAARPRSCPADPAGCTNPSWPAPVGDPKCRERTDGRVPDWLGTAR